MTVTRAKKLAAAMALAALASACATWSLDEVAESPSYQFGYADGCQTGRETSRSFSTTTTRDDHAFDTDEAYRTGWRQGYLECRPPERVDDARSNSAVYGDRDESRPF